MIVDKSHPLAHEDCGKIGLNGCITRPLGPHALFEAVYDVARLWQAAQAGRPVS